MIDRQSPPLLEVRQATKRFPGVLALNRVDLTLQRGEVLAVVGENGAGKSTLMRILAGVEHLDAGRIRLLGQPAHLDSVREATRAGIALIHQELNLSDNLSVAANIFLGREPRRLAWIHGREIQRRAQEVMTLVGLDISPRTLVARLPIGRRQMVEIARALSIDARILIMDEPTSSLTQRETDTLFDVVRQLRSRGVGIIYISHRLSEVRAIADRVLVLRDGENAGELERGEITHDRMVRLMVGRNVARYYQRRPRRIGPPQLQLDNFITPAHPTCRLSLTVGQGEIVGIAGLVGAGRTELLHALFAVDRPLAGQVKLAGKTYRLQGPRDAIRAGMALVPEDRKLQGLILEMAVRDNITLANLRRLATARFLTNRKRESESAFNMIRQLRIKTPTPRQQVQYLSGGNQQKVVLAKWLATNPRVLLLDEPTRGVDVGAKEEIYRLMEQLAEQQVSILFASSEMEEILGMSDRVIVMHEGRLAGELSRTQMTEEAIMQLATGRSNPQ